MAYDLDRFLSAQAGVYDQALAEIRAGRKRSHWMWFVFPQVSGLGRSAMAERYAITCLAEAEAYLAHPVLGARLREITQALLDHPSRDAHRVLGSPDDLKLRSSMTLFERAEDGDEQSVFTKVLDEFYSGQRDAVTLGLLAT